MTDGGGHRETMFDSPWVQVLEYRECLRLLDTVPMGRVLYTEEALPAFRLVDFKMCRGAVIIRSRRESRLAAAMRDSVVAFQVEEMTEDLRAGWTVSVVGHVSEVRGREDFDAFSAPPLWAPVDSYFEIAVERITGERIDPGRP